MFVIILCGVILFVRNHWKRRANHINNTENISLSQMNKPCTGVPSPIYESVDVDADYVDDGKCISVCFMHQ